MAIDLRRTSDLEKGSGGLKQTLKRKVLGKGPIYGSVPPTNTAVPVGQPFTPGAQVPALRVPGGGLAGSPLQAAAQDVVFTEIPQGRLGAPPTRPQIGYTPKSTAIPKTGKLSLASIKNMLKPSNLKASLGPGLAVAAIEHGLARPTAIAKQDEYVPTVVHHRQQDSALPAWSGERKIELPKGYDFSTLPTHQVDPITGERLISGRVKDRPKIHPNANVDWTAEKAKIAALSPTSYYNDYGTPDPKLDQETSNYGVQYGGKDYAMGTEGSKGAMEKAKGPLTLYGKEKPLTPEERAANAALDMKRINENLALHRASNERDRLEGESRQAALDKGMAQARATTPWYAGGTDESRQAGALQLASALQKEKEDSAIQAAQGRSDKQQETPEMIAAKVAKYNAEAQQALAQAEGAKATTAALPTKAEQAKQKMYENRLAVYSKMLQEADKLGTDEEKNAAKEQAEAFLNDMERYKSGTTPAVKGFMGFGEKEPAKDVYSYRPRLQGKERALLDEILKGA